MESESSLPYSQLVKLTVQNNAIFRTIVYEDPIGGLGPSQPARIKTQLLEFVTPAGSESCTNTEGHPLIKNGSSAFETKRTVSKNSKMFSGSKLA
jgi:hypothetical protein